MIRALKPCALGCLLVLALASCARSSTAGGPTPTSVYRGSLQLSDVAPLLDDGAHWAPGAPTFGIRPLDVANTLPEQRLALTLRYLHVGTAETLTITYLVWDSSTVATAIVTNTQTAVGSTLTGPPAGDQVLYYTQMFSFSAAPYVAVIMVRVGQTVATIEWARTPGFAATSQSGKLAGKVASKLKDALAGKLKASPPPAVNPLLLPAPGPDLVLLGATRLPIDVLASMLDAASPSDLKGFFSQLGVTDFAYGDYTLDADTHMEFQTSAFTFSSPTDATDWLNTAIGATNLDSSGNYITFDQTTEQYEAFFAAGSHGVIIICKSSAQFEAASRSCEAPLSRVVTAWKADLTALG